MGYILYKLVARKQEFPADFAVHARRSSMSRIRVPVTDGYKKETVRFIINYVNSMLQPKPSSRPTMKALLKDFIHHCTKSIQVAPDSLCTLF